MTQTNDDLAPALDLLGGEVYVDNDDNVTGAVYWAAEVGRYYAPDRRALADLAGRLERGERDAYSLWCAEGGAVPSAATARGAARKAGFLP